MRYKNKLTGAVIDVPCEIKGDWEPVVEKVKAEPKKTAKKTEAKKKK